MEEILDILELEYQNYIYATARADNQTEYNRTSLIRNYLHELLLKIKDKI